MPPNVLDRIRRLIRHHQYEFTRHARQEAMADDLHRVDIEAAILTGELHRTEYDPLGRKYVIVGQATDLTRQVGIVFRFTPDSQSGIIITVYEIEKAT